MKLPKLGTITLIVGLSLSCSNGITSKAAAPCNVPATIGAQIAGSASYNSRDQAAPLNPESYSAVRIGDRWFIRDNNAQDAESRGLRPVLIYENSRWWTGADLRCPANASWVKCAAEWDPYASLPETARPPKKKQAAAAGPSCDFEVRVPKWAPSPDSDEKRRIAGELLQELRQKQDRTTTLKAVYVRDFNLNDPVINVYVEDSLGAHSRWYEFYATAKPHIYGGSGGFGTVSQESTKQWIMELPYRLYPPPVGKP